MFPSFASRLLASVLLVILVASCFASPRNSKLLPLVPPGAAIVVGFENPHGARIGGRLVLSTTNNRLDLDDWLALTGIDTKRVFDEVIEADGITRGGELRDHLLLVAGRFDRNRIFGALQQNGAETALCEGEPVLPVKPFAREQQRMLDTRWLAILENRIAIFGTTAMVQKALNRFQTHAIADPILEERLTLLRPDVTSWNILTTTPGRSKNLMFARPHPEWARVMEGADVLLVAAHFGFKIRVDFSLHAGDNRGATYFAEKAALFGDVFQLAPTNSRSAPAPLSRVQNLSVETDHVVGSVSLSRKQFDDWVVELSRAPVPHAQSQVAAAHGN